MTEHMERPLNSTSGSPEQPELRRVKRTRPGSRPLGFLVGLTLGSFAAFIGPFQIERTARAQGNPQESASPSGEGPSGSAGGAWEKEKSEDGIEISSRSRTGSAYRELRGTTVIDAPPEAFLPLLRDAEGYRSWLAECKASNAVGTKQSPNDFHLYAVIGIPWPFEDRDTVAKVKVRRLPGSKGVVAFLRSMNDELAPTRKGLVRMKSLEGQLLAEGIGGGKSRLELRIFLEPAGSLSPVFVNSTAASIQLKTLKNVRDRIAKLARLPGSLDAPELGITDPSLSP